MRSRERVPRVGMSIDQGPLHASISIDLDPVFRHVNEFLGLRCAPDLLALGVFPRGTTAKEVTESMAAFVAARKVLGVERLGDATVRVLDIGAGRSPRTGALFAFRSRWEVIAIDPELRAEKWTGKIHRLECVPKRIQDVRIECPGLAILTLVHAHVQVLDALRSVEATEYLVVALPCCVPHDLPRETDLQYGDFGCWSPKRQIKIWRLSREQRDELIAPESR
jgi:hypothetical protein